MSYLDKLVAIKKEIGNTPLVKLVVRFNNEEKIIYAKEEFKNPSGSIKIRPAYQILFDAIKEGKLKEGQEVVEVTSGNMGIALAYLLNKLGNPLTILMPSNMSNERKEILRNLGANIVLTHDFLDAFKMQKEYEKNGAFLPQQFENVSNTKAHQETALEILNNIDDFDAFVSGVGTGGTLIGMGGYLKNLKNIKLIAIDPAESSLLLNGKSLGKHKIQGLSDQIIPSLYKKDLVDQIIEIKSDDAICMARKFKEKFGIGIGISSGGNILGALLSSSKKIVTVFADDDSKYLSTDLTNKDITSSLVNSIELISLELVK